MTAEELRDMAFFLSDYQRSCQSNGFFIEIERGQLVIRKAPDGKRVEVHYDERSKCLTYEFKTRSTDVSDVMP